MRLAIVTFFSGKPWYASELLWYALAQNALSRGDEVAIFTIKAPDQGEQYAGLERDGALVYERRLFRRAFWYRILARRQFNDLFRFKPDVVFVSQPGPLCITSYPDARHLMHRLVEESIPYAVMAHNNADTDVARTTSWNEASSMYGQACLVGQYSNASRCMLERQIARALPQSRIFYNPINLSNVGEMPWPNSERPTMAVAARLVAQVKGQDILFEALAGGIAREHGWLVRLFGDGPDREYLQALARYYDIDDIVEFRGHASDVRRIWAEIQVIVVPSRYEAGPMVLPEAMLCGRCVLSTPVGFAREWVHDGENGFLTTEDSTEALSVGLQRLWDVRDTWQQIGERARSSALRQFDPDPGQTLYKALCESAGLAALSQQSPSAIAMC